MFLNSLESRDYPVIQGVNLFFATVVVGINLIIDLIYAFLDPRVQYK
jgi:ABC-type dipeptide/oligopeptide/nickel transport system permease component